jgi:hypothetical protein
MPRRRITARKQEFLLFAPVCSDTERFLIAKSCPARFYQVFVKTFESLIHRRLSLPSFAIVTRSGDNDTSEVLDFIRCGIGTTVALEIRGESLERRSKVKKICILTVAIVFTWLTVASAQVWVDPYTRKDGTYVGGHYRSRPYGNPYNNRSYPGKVNPYTGKPAAGNPNRYLEQYQNRNNFRSHSPNQYQLNPYQRRW